VYSVHHGPGTLWQEPQPSQPVVRHLVGEEARQLDTTSQLHLSNHYSAEDAATSPHAFSSQRRSSSSQPHTYLFSPNGGPAPSRVLELDNVIFTSLRCAGRSDSPKAWDLSPDKGSQFALTSFAIRFVLVSNVDACTETQKECWATAETEKLRGLLSFVIQNSCCGQPVFWNWSQTPNGRNVCAAWHGRSGAVLAQVLKGSSTTASDLSAIAGLIQRCSSKGICWIWSDSQLELTHLPHYRPLDGPPLAVVTPRSRQPGCTQIMSASLYSYGGPSDPTILAFGGVQRFCRSVCHPLNFPRSCTSL
jgi:hypothetical protein